MALFPNAVLVKTVSHVRRGKTHVYEIWDATKDGGGFWATWELWKGERAFGQWGLNSVEHAEKRIAVWSAAKAYGARS